MNKIRFVIAVPVVAFALACGGGPPDPNSIEGWTAASTAERISKAGWTPESCDAYDDPGYVDSLMCGASKGDLHADIEVDRYSFTSDAKDAGDGWDPSEAVKRDGRGVVTVRVYDGEGSKALLTGMLPEGTKLVGKDQAWLESAAKAQGWTASDCESYKEGPMHDIDCELRKGDATGSVTLSIDPDLDFGDSTLEMSDGAASYYENGAGIDVIILDGPKAKTLLDGLMAG